MGEPERVLLHQVRHRRLICWERAGWRLGPWAALVTIGQLTEDGRWYVDVVWNRGDGWARLYGTEAEARQVAAQWRDRISGEWQQIPCYPTEEALRTPGRVSPPRPG